MTRTIEYVLPGLDQTRGHALGVTVLTKNSAGVLFSGGRDGRIVAWANPDQAPRQVSSTQVHTNWITGLVAAGQKIASCSNDTTVNLWDESLTAHEKLGNHRDYATALTMIGGFSDSNSQDYTIVSGGLDGHIFGWSPHSPGKPKFDFYIPGDRGSVYSIAASQLQPIVASGTPDSIVRLWDHRQPAKPVQRLMGHTDNIRALAIVDDWLLSASSDATVKLWSLTGGKLFKTFSEHSQSVWSLFVGTASPDRGTFLSADRAGVVMANSPDESEAILSVGAGVTDMALCGSILYTAGATPNLQGFDIASEDPRPLVKPKVELEGHHGLRKYRLLNDKRRALTLDTAGNVNMVDITRGIRLDFSTRVTGDDSDTEFDKVLDQVNTEHVLDNWCHVAVRAGQLVVRLDERSVANTEVYADELMQVEGLDSGEVLYDDEKRINLGQWTLTSLLSSFIDQQMGKYNASIAALSQQVSHSSLPPREPSPLPPVPQTAEDLAASDKDGGKVEKKSRFKRLFGIGKKDATPVPAEPATPVPGLVEPPDTASSQPSTTIYDGVAEAAPYSQSATPTPPPLQPTPGTASTSEEDEDMPASFIDMFNNAVKVQSFSPLSTTDAPAVRFDPRTRLIVSESAAEAGSATCVYTQEIGNLDSPKDVQALEKQLPGWVGDIVMQGNLPQRNPTKIGFLVLFENKEGHESGHMEKSRLMANPILRARKIMTYILKQMVNNKKLPESVLDSRPEDVISLTCQDQVIDPNTMLSVIRTRIWRAGGEVQLHYKLLVDTLA